MTIKELIQILSTIDNTKPVYIFNNSNIYPVNDIDVLSDRVDINLNHERAIYEKT